MVRDVKEQSGRRKGWVRYNPDHGGGVGGHQIDGIGCGDIGGDGGGILFMVTNKWKEKGTTLDDGAGGDHHGGGDDHEIGVGVGGVDGDLLAYLFKRHRNHHGQHCQNSYE